MKKGGIFALLAGGAAVAGALWYLNKKKNEETKNTVLYSEEFDEATEVIDAPAEAENGDEAQ